ncbi:PREDICTED: surfeit locus protein 1-like [Amphimedon queenslandica]|uniref:SURF1-like protein n=1 Tax=Amphimedon queenslandica TaxID=400682 RepID=A0A1X7UQP7_AMPQE|nr:PREDICTED: surfeit locus protein 1-like [Amphimedon queenslandica]|eukprot:XP_003387040.1 PREDICTED: surfeit locus protein 1-like [Amphimedon queenslandica]
MFWKRFNSNFKTGYRLFLFHQKRFATKFKGSQPQSNRHLWLLIIPFTTFGLGTWQIFRLQWKVDLIDRLERKMLKSPVPIPFDIKDQLEEFEYRRVTLTGSYDHSREMLMWPRVQINEEKKPIPGNRGSEPGAFVITPFHCNETKSDVLVNRGWVPKARMDPSMRPHGQVQGEIEITAIVRTGDTRGLFGPKNEPENNYWAWRDLEAMSNHAHTDTIWVDADATTTVKGGPIGGQTKVKLRNEHLQYVFTWYALSLATGYMFWQLWKKVKKR